MLRSSGLDVAILDKETFPRNKVCGGWITPAVLDELEIDPAEYSCARVLQPITGFRTGSIGGPAVATQYGKPVSYGIRRYEFDDYLLKRSGATLLQGEPLTRLERSDDSWIVNGRIRTPLVVGAGGHFCPVARFMGAKFGDETIVAAQEAEFEMDARQQVGCAIRAETPELYFCADMKGYGWCFRKGNILNVGLGRLDKHQLSRHVADFLDFLRATKRLSFELPVQPAGHAYLLYGRTTRPVVADGMLLIATAHGYRREQLSAYRTLLTERFGKSDDHWVTRIGSRLPQGFINTAARKLLANPWFTREMILNRWFLRSHEPALEF
jgi:flavin-dependent dehydrogenase